METEREEILRVFATESQEQLDALEAALLRLERHPGDQETIHELFRLAHTLKGNARVVQLGAIEAFTHTFEEVLERVRSGVLAATPELVTLLLRAADGLRRVIPRSIAGVDDAQPEHAALTAWLAAQRPAVDSAAAPTATEGEHGGGAEEPRILRVAVEQLDRMLNLVGEITIARGRLDGLLGGTTPPALAELRDAHHEADRLYLELQGELMRARMVPLGPTFTRFLRVVRDLAAAHDREAELAIAGGDVKVDTAVVEGIRDPLMHMIRNAIAHGVEPSEARRAKGKAPRGTITVSARHEAGSIIIAITDDGKGLSRESILKRARAMRLVGDLEQPSDASLFKLIFAPGFSTAESVTELSGRGMGMNVVQRNIEALRGTVAIASQPDRGTTITLRLPLTLAIIEGFSVTVGGETYVLPLDAVVECVDLPPAERRRDDAQGVIDLRGRPLPYVRLARLFGLARDASARESLVVLQHDGSRAGVAVDALCGAGQIVIKPLAQAVRHAPAVAGCALLGSGRVALILSVPALLRAAVAGGLAPTGCVDAAAAGAASAGSQQIEQGSTTS